MAASPQTPPNLPIFRVPPPSPAATPRNTLLEPADDDDFSRFLKRSRRVPELILPHRNPPQIDLGYFTSPEKGGSEKENLRSAARSIGCFQIINHGIKERVIEAAIEAAEKVFGVPLEKKKEAAKSPERMWGFEVEEGEDAVERDEFFWSDGTEEMERVLAQKTDTFRMVQLLKKIKKISRKLELVLMYYSPEHNIHDPIEWRNEADNMIICLRKHRRRNEADHSEEKMAFDLNQDMLGAFLRSLSSSHALSFHIFNGASRFRAYCKQAQVSFRPAHGAIVACIGRQMQEKSGGIYKQVIGKPEYSHLEAQQKPISITFLHSFTALHQASASSSKSVANKEEEKIISISKQLIVASCLLLLYHIIAYFYFARV